MDKISEEAGYGSDSDESDGEAWPNLYGRTWAGQAMCMHVAGGGPTGDPFPDPKDPATGLVPLETKHLRIFFFDLDHPCILIHRFRAVSS